MGKVFLLCLIVPSIGYSWGSIGHRVIGKIAAENLKECAKSNVQKLLGKENMSEASIWADTVKSDPGKDFQKTWHWLNIADDIKFKGQQTNPKGDAIWAIKHSLDILKEKTKDKRINDSQALKLLIHIVGDIHQPLHAGRALDKGGHNINVYFFNRISMLHVVWDTEILDFWKLSYSELAESISRRLGPAGNWKSKPIYSWIGEAQELRKVIYTFGKIKKDDYKLLSVQKLKDRYKDIYNSYKPPYNKMGPGEISRNFPYIRGLKIPVIQYEYIARVTPIIEQRLYKAGIRLAWLLNDMWCNKK